MTARAAFKQDDVTRACRGAIAAGLQIARIVVKDGEIAIVTDAGASRIDQPEVNPWDAEAED